MTRFLAVGAVAIAVAGCFGPSAKAVGDFANVKADKVGKRGQPVTVTATFTSGGCENDARVFLAVNEAARTVTVTGEVLTPYNSPFFPRACPTGIGYFDRAATFVPTQVGEYLVKAKVWPYSHQGPYDHFDPPIAVSSTAPSGPYDPVDGTIKVQVTE